MGLPAKAYAPQVPALHRALLRARVWRPWDANADIGGDDSATDALAAVQVANIIYDPFTRPEGFNKASLDTILAGVASATVSDVLNTIREPSVRAAIIQVAATAAAPMRMAFFTVYEGDCSGVGKMTPDGWQENRTLNTYLPEISRYFETATPAIVEGLRVLVGFGSKADLSKLRLLPTGRR